MSTLRVAIEGCYPTFASTDLVMRILAVLRRVELVSRWQTYDLLIRGPFSDGNLRRRLVNRSLQLKASPFKSSSAISLHVSSENTFNTNYQGFEESQCSFGIGHEIRSGDHRYFRIPHWWNYVDFSEDGVPSPSEWPRLGAAISQEALLAPLKWNACGSYRAAFVCSYLDANRAFLLREVDKVITVDGYGKPFDSSIQSHSLSGFTKRELLNHYDYSLCPENSISPGYVTEKIPEAFACGTIPISYVDPHGSLDFNVGSFVNLYDYLRPGISKSLTDILGEPCKRSKLLNTPLLNQRIQIEAAIEFLRNVVRLAAER